MALQPFYREQDGHTYWNTVDGWMAAPTFSGGEPDWDNAGYVVDFILNGSDEKQLNEWLEERRVHVITSLLLLNGERLSSRKFEDYDQKSRLIGPLYIKEEVAVGAALSLAGVRGAASYRAYRETVDNSGSVFPAWFTVEEAGRIAEGLRVPLET